MTTGADMERLARAAAGKLTTAQKRAVLELPDEFSFYPVTYARVTIKRLMEAGLLTRRPPASGFGFAVHRWTDLGLAVRRILNERPNDADE